MSARTLSSGRELYEFDGVQIIVPADETTLIVRNWCEICDDAIVTHEDVVASDAIGTCDRCYNVWYMPDTDRWNMGWRPTDDMIAFELSSRPPLAVLRDLSKVDGNASGS